MPLISRSSLRRAALALLCVFTLVAGPAAQAGAEGAATAVSAVRMATGHSASQLWARPACGVAHPGQIRCLAQVLVVRRSGRAAALLHVPHVRPAGAAASAATPPAQFTAPYLQWAYDTSWLSANRGAADTVAIVDAYGDATAYTDMEQFRSANGLPSQPVCGGSVTISCFEVVNQNGQSSPLPSSAHDETGSWNVEESLDIDAVSTICPLCRIIVVEANSDDSGNTPDLETAVSSAARLGADQISLSWGSDTTADAAANAAPYDSITSAAILAAAGDASYPGPSVGYPAALPGVTAVGGTALSTSSSAARGFNETTWSKQVCAGGSVCGTESGCDTTQAQPAYQSGVTTGCTGRAYNDIAADGDPNTGLDVYDSQPGSEGCGTPNNWCIVGGTSLATPLVAAFEAVSGISDTTPAWTYSDAALLNDITSGSDGTCPAGQTVICNAGAGWDGPTGNGSISGDVVAGGPGIGLQPGATGVGATQANVSAKVDPNDTSVLANTTYHWQYGLTSGYGSLTAPTSLSPGTSFLSASATLSALSLPCTYHYRILASNALGTTYGYDHTVTTSQTTSAPVNTVAPAVTGNPAIGQPLSEQGDQWSGVDCQDTTYQWQESSTPSGPWTAISGATAQTYTPTTSNAGNYLKVVVTRSNNGGSTSAASQPTAQVPAAAVVTAPTTTTPATTTPATTTPATPTTTTTAPTTTVPPTTTTVVVRFYRCARTCVLINTHGAIVYRPRRADWGRYIKVMTTTTRTSGNNGPAVSVTTRWVGPISSSRAGSVLIRGSAHAAAVLGVRANTHRPIAWVRIVRRSGRTLTLAIRRPRRAPTKVWAYVIRRGAVVSCTTVHMVRGTLTLRVSSKPDQTLRLVAVQS